MDALHPLPDLVISDMTDAEISRTEPDGPVFFVGNENKIASRVNGIILQSGWRR